jgi:hypothetical protein
MDGDSPEVAKLMDEIRDLIELLIDTNPGGWTRLEILISQIKEDARMKSEFTQGMQAIEAWAEICDSEKKPTYH